MFSRSHSGECRVEMLVILTFPLCCFHVRTAGNVGCKKVAPAFAPALHPRIQAEKLETEARNRVAEIAENAKPLAMQGGDRQSNNFKITIVILKRLTKVHLPTT